MSTLSGFTDFSPAFIDSFNAGWYLLSKQKSKLWDVIPSGNKTVQNSDTAYYKRLGSGDLSATGAKGTDTAFASLSIDQRAVTLTQYGRADLLSYDEIISMGGEDPTGQLIQRHAEAVARKRDEVILAALLGSAAVKGASAVAFPAGQTVAADYGSTGTDTNITLGKIRRAKVLLDKKGVPEEGRVAVINSEMNDALLAIAEVQSFLSNTAKPLVEGAVMRFLGFDYIVSDLVNVSSSIADGIFFHPTALQVGYNDMPATTIDRLPTHNNNYAVQTSTFIGAVRMEEEAVVKLRAKIS